MEQQLKAPDEKFCSSCGEIIKILAELCPKCGVRQLPIPASVKVISPKSRTLTSLLCFFLGWLGAHRFYVGKIVSGIMQILLGWCTLGIWWLVDLIMILSGKFRDKNHNLIEKWT